jgi:hypothetical protein
MDRHASPPTPKGNPVKKNVLLPLLGGLALSSAALASTDYTLTTSANFEGHYTFNDSGLYVSNGSDWLGQTSVINTQATVLNTFQDATTHQWFARTEFKTIETSTTTYQNYTRSGRNFYLQGDSSITDNWLELGLTPSAGLTTFDLYARGTVGYITSGRGNNHVVLPALDLSIGASTVSGTWNTWNNGNGVTDANAYLTGSLPGDGLTNVQLVLEAAPHANVSELYFNMYGAKTLGTIGTYSWTNTTNTWVSDVAINAPVPEPQTYALLLAGLLMVGSTARRRSRR